MAVGPFLGSSIVQGTTSRWFFYVSLPVGAPVTWLVVGVHPGKVSTLMEKFNRIGFAGTVIFILASVWVLLHSRLLGQSTRGRS